MNKGKKSFTGERFIPGIEDKKLEVEHYQRYRCICDFVKGKKVLDAACGEGYGSSLLAEYAESVVGIDISENAVRDARKKYHNHKNLTFEVGSINQLPLGNKSIDVVVSYETIEHVNSEIQIQFLQEITRVIEPKGVLIISTPNKKVYTDLYDYHNEYHKKEFYKDEFVAFLKASFQNVKLYNQFFEVTAVIDSNEEELNQITYYKENSGCQEGKYYIALATNGRLPENSISSVYVNCENEYKENMQRIIKLQMEEEARNKHIQKLDGELIEKGKLIEELQGEILQRNDHIQKLDFDIQHFEKSIMGKNEEIYQKDSILQQKDKVIQQKEKTMQQKVVDLQNINSCFENYKVETKVVQESHKRQMDDLQKMQNCLRQQVENQKLEVQEKEENLRQIKMELRDVQSRVMDLEKNEVKLQQIVCNKVGHIELLLEVERSYEREKLTHSYRMVKGIQSIGNVILPLDSRRRFFLHIIRNVFQNPKLMFRVINPARIKNYIKYMRKEGMDGVKSRYEIAVAKERSYRYPSTNLELQIEKNSINNNIQSYGSLEFIKYDNPLISIIIPVYNAFDYTYNCLKSILKNSGCINVEGKALSTIDYESAETDRGYTYEILIADDCSTDTTVHMQEKIKNIKMITTEHNLGFLLNCNNAAKYAKGNYILFLNNDTQVQGNWLKPLIDLIEKDSTIGMVGAKLIYADGRLQEAGGIVWKDASAWNYGHLLNPEEPAFNYIKEVDYISGAAIMIRQKLWNEIGGFDERFIPAYYEDTDLAFEVRRHGYKVVYQPLSRIVHFEGVSNGTDLNEGMKQYQATNLTKFYEKWKDVLEVEQTENGNMVFKAKDRSIHKKHILVIDHYVPHYDKDAGGKCSYMYLKLFLHMGFKVTFMGDNFYNHEPYTTELNQMGIEVLYGNYYYNNWENWLKENSHYFDYIYLQRPHISIKYIDLVKKYSDAKIFYFAHDLHHIRERREYELTNDIEKLKSAEYWKKIEYELFRKADVGHVVGSYEQDIMQRAFPNKLIRNIPLYIYEDSIQNVNKDFSTRKDLIYVGGFGHPPNIDAVLWFAQSVFPRILKKHPDIKWHVVGGQVPKKIAELANESIFIEGFVPDEKLDVMYRECRLAVVPLRVGAGVKGKVVEAAYYQIPLVTTTIGAEGICGTDGNFAIVDDAEEMADFICKLYVDYSKLTAMSDSGKKFIQDNFTLEVAEKVICADMVRELG